MGTLKARFLLIVWSGHLPGSDAMNVKNGEVVSLVIKYLVRYSSLLLIAH